VQVQQDHLHLLVALLVLAELLVVQVAQVVVVLVVVAQVALAAAALVVAALVVALAALVVVALVGLDYRPLVVILATILSLKEGKYPVASRLRLPSRNARGVLL